MCLLRTVIWILPEDHHFHVVKNCCVECIKDQTAGWVNYFPLGFFNLNMVSDAFEIRFVKFFFQNFLPAFVNFDIHRSILFCLQFKVYGLKLLFSDLLGPYVITTSIMNLLTVNNPLTETGHEFFNINSFTSICKRHLLPLKPAHENFP